MKLQYVLTNFAFACLKLSHLTLLFLHYLHSKLTEGHPAELGLTLFITSPVREINYNNQSIEFRRFLGSLLCCGYIEEISDDEKNSSIAVFCDCKHSSVGFGQAISRRDSSFATVQQLSATNPCIHQQVILVIWQSSAMQRIFPTPLLPNGSAEKPGLFCLLTCRYFSISISICLCSMQDINLSPISDPFINADQDSNMKINIVYPDGRSEHSNNPFCLVYRYDRSNAGIGVLDSTGKCITCSKICSHCAPGFSKHYENVCCILYIVVLSNCD